MLSSVLVIHVGESSVALFSERNSETSAEPEVPPSAAQNIKSNLHSVRKLLQLQKWRSESHSLMQRVSQHSGRGFLWKVVPASRRVTVPMKFCGSEENQRLERLLDDNLAREMRLWKAPVLKGGCIQGSDITPSLYQEIVFWLCEMSETFMFSSETFALGVCVLNRLLATVKVIASVKDLLVQSGCNFSIAEILRMERIILDKLHWDLYTATPVDFIHIFHGLLVSARPHLALAVAQKRFCFQASLWTKQVQHCMACHQLWQFKGSTLALAIITLELEMLMPDWFSFFSDLLKKAQIDSTDFIYCKEMVDEYLTSLQLSLPTNAVYILHTTDLKLRAYKDGGVMDKHRGDQAMKMKRGNGGWEVDDFYDGFSCLYNEVSPMELEGSGPENMNGSLQAKVMPCPPLQPLLN
uniref:Cyclin I family member 2 n=2 Tax=Astyanax mexicanus TaxID=7994 RepID=A0A3B1KK13_ASTMX